MKFKKFDGPKVFLSSPIDLTILRGNFVKMFYNLREKVTYHQDIMPFAWEWDKPEGGYDQGRSIVRQIPLAKGAYCKALICLFAERIGTPLANAEQYVGFLGGFEKLRTNKGEHLVLDWKPGDENDGGFALTGTVFELLTVLSENKYLEEKGMKTIPLRIIFIGDESILEEYPEDANWGNRKLFNQKEAEYKKEKRRGRDFDEWKRNVYYPQVQQLKNLIGFLMEKGNVQIDTEDSIFIDSEDALRKCEKFLIENLGYKLNYDKNPFKGLQYYDEEDHEFFLGRNDWIDRALEQFAFYLKNSEYSPFFGVLGGSGVGKSSLLRAGLIYQLKNSDKYGLFKGIVLTANDLITSSNAKDNRLNIFKTSLGKLLYAALVEIYTIDDLEKNKRILSAQDSKRISQSIKHLNDIKSEEKIGYAIECLLTALNRKLEGETESINDNLNLVIGLDQFEEFLDYWQSDKENQDLEELFDFFQLACTTKQIGFIYTCQTNRRPLLTANEKLALLVEKGHQKEVRALNEDEIRQIVKEKFSKMNISLGERIIEELHTNIKQFSIKNESDIGQLTQEEAKATLLPLFSLTLLRIYEYCQKRRKEVEQESFDSKSVKVEPSQGKAFLDENNVLILPLEEDLKPILNVEEAIAELADAALKELIQTLGVESIDEELTAILRRLVRIQSAAESRYFLLPMTVPENGFGKNFVDSFRKYRLLVPVNLKQVRLVHEAIIQYWKKAVEIIENEKTLLIASEKLIYQATAWEKGHWSLKVITQLAEENKELVDFAGLVLFDWWDVLTYDDDYQLSKSDKLLRDFSIELLKAVKIPNYHVTGTKNTTFHFLLAVYYGEMELVEEYLEIDKSAAQNYTSSKGNNAAMSAILSKSMKMVNLVLKEGADTRAVNNDGWYVIHYAADFGNIDCFDKLVSLGADPTVTGAAERNCLHCAAQRDRIVLLRHLINDYKKINLNAQDAYGWTPLQIACRNSSLETFNILIAVDDIDTSLATQDGWTVLHSACRYGNAEMVTSLLKKTKTDPKAETTSGWTPLQLAIYNESVDVNKNRSKHPIVALLKDERIERNGNDTLQRTPLNLAIDANNIEIVALLLNDRFKKIDPNIFFENELPPLFKACTKRDFDLIYLLIKAGANVNGNSEQFSPFLEVVKLGDVEIFNLLFPKVDISNEATGGKSALQIATKNGHQEIVKILLENKFIQKQINAIEPDDDGRNLLHLAVRSGLLGLVESFFNYFDSKYKDKLGSAPIHMAVESGFIDITRHFLKSSPELANLPDGTGRALFHIAAVNGNVAFFEEFGDDFNLQIEDAQGMTPIHYATRFKKPELVKYLLEERKIDPNVQDNYGWTPLHIAAQNGDSEIINILLEHKAKKSIVGSKPAFLPVHSAIQVGHKDLLEVLLPEYITPKPLIKLLDELLLLAEKYCQPETVSEILMKQELLNIWLTEN